MLNVFVGCLSSHTCKTQRILDQRCQCSVISNLKVVCNKLTKEPV